jgi:hypothetical protein
MLRIERVVPAARVALGLTMLAVTCALGDSGSEIVPKAREKVRYQGLAAHCPFSLASAPVATPAPQASFAANWFVSGIGRIGGKDFVSIKSRDLSTQFSLYAGEQRRANEIALVSVTWSDAVGKSTVILRKGTETAKLEFNEAEVHQAPKGPVMAGNAPANNVARPPGSGVITFAPPTSTSAAALARNPIAPQGLAVMPAQRRRVAPIRPPQ